MLQQAHTRDIHTDLLLTVLLELLKNSTDLKVIVMSATLDVSKWQGHFQNFHCELDIVEDLRWQPESGGQPEVQGVWSELDCNRGFLDPEGRYSPSTLLTVRSLPESIVHFQLISSVLKWVDRPSAGFRNSEDQDELEREERRKRGLYGLSNSEKACFSRFTQPSLEAVRRATASKEERRRSKSTARSEASGGSGTASKSGDASPKGQKRRLAILVNKQALTDLEMTEEAVHRILRVLFPSNPSAMARVGSSYRRQRGRSDKMLAFQMSNTAPLLPTLEDGRTSPAMRRSLSSSFKTMKMERVESNGKEPKSEHRPLQSPRTALDQSLKKIWPTADAQQVKKMGDLLKRELNLRSHVKQPGEQLPRRQPLYVTPDAAGTKSNVKEFVNSAKLESSLAGEVWDSTGSNNEAPDRRVFHRMKNAAFLVSKIGEITEEINKERAEIRKLQRKQVTAPVNDECNFSLRSFRKRLLGKHQCLADAFRVLDLNVNQKIGPQEWGAMFRGSGLATFREARMSFELLDLNRDGSVTLAEFQAALEGVAEIAGIDGLRKRLVSFGYTKTLQVLEIIEASGVDPSKLLSLEEFGAALCRIHVVEPNEHQAIFDNVRDRGDPTSKASVNDLMAALGSVGPWMLLEDLADRCHQKWDSADATWAGLGPGDSGDSITLQAFEKKLEKLGLKHMAAQKASRILDVDAGGELSRSELLSALALSRPTLHMEDFRRKVQQRYRSIEAIFRESFEHMENEELNNDDDMRLSCDEFAEILEALDFSRRETSYLFWLADANGTKRLTLYEFFRGVKLFVPSCMVEALRLQGLARHARISDLFRHCGISWEKRLGPKAFAQLLQKLDIKCEDPHDAFDFLDVRSCGSISLREVVATLQNVMPGTKERSTLWECDRRAEKDVRNYLAPLHKTVTALKTTMKQDIEEDTPPPARTSVCSRTERRRSSNRLAFNKTDLGFYLAQETFQRISSDAEAQGLMSQPKATDYCGAKTVEDLCGYLKSSSSTMELHGKLLSQHYSRTDWHQRHNRIKAVLARKI
eukprot:s88_g47.t1